MVYLEGSSEGITTSPSPIMIIGCPVFHGSDGYETYVIDENTMGVRPIWFSVKDQPAPKDKPFLAEVLLGNHFLGKDDRTRDIRCCVWNEFSERFTEHCDCSGYDHEIESIEILNWMPLPKPPKK